MPRINIPLNNIGRFTTSNRRKRFGFGSLLITLFVGIIFTVAGFTLFRGNQVDDNWVTIQGEVVDIETSASQEGSTMHRPVVGYSVDGEEYTIASGSSTAARPSLGEAREVAYNPDNPEEAVIPSATMFWLTIAFMLLGVGMIIGAPIGFILSRKRTKDISSLKETGQKVDGVVVDIQAFGGSRTNRRRSRMGNSRISTGLASSSRGSYRVVVATPDQNGNTKQYVSDSMEGLGGIAMLNFQQNPIPVSVYIDPSNPDNYYVDIEALPSLTPQRITEMFQSAVGGQQQQSQSAQPPTTMQAAAQSPVPPQSPQQNNQPAAPLAQPNQQSAAQQPATAFPPQQPTPAQPIQQNNQATINPIESAQQPATNQQPAPVLSPPQPTSQETPVAENIQQPQQMPQLNQQPIAQQTAQPQVGLVNGENTPQTVQPQQPTTTPNNETRNN